MENLIRLQQQAQNEAKAKTDAYTAAMNNGNSFFVKKEYAEAKNSYNEALKNRPGDALALDQIKKLII